ncbi:MAG: hypothetical protein JO306_08425 [Gemmatimonadetes bacterium]|nr:hypothetical protein [Gemmatimonadota bacterium]
MPNRSILAAAAALAAAVHPLAAQAGNETADSSRAEWSLDRTMREFIHAVFAQPAGFFPAHGDWDWVLTARGPDGRPHRLVQRFPGAQTKEAMQPGRPLCDSFHGSDAVPEGTIMEPQLHVLLGRPDRLWRRTRGTHFVPPDADKDSPVFVEWRREDGRWVVSAIGEDGDNADLPRRTHVDLPQQPRTPLRLPLPAETKVAADAAWFTGSEPVFVWGHRWVKYGGVRDLKEGDVVQVAADYRGVAVWVETDARYVPPYMYLPVDREGHFQAYTTYSVNGCH